jgi:hypothetical protein
MIATIINYAYGAHAIDWVLLLGALAYAMIRINR